MKPLPLPMDWRLVHAAVVLLVAVLFFLSLDGVLTPLVLFGALLVLVMPYAGTPFHRLLVVTGSVLVAFWLLAAMGSLLAPFILAFVLAYAFDPVVDRLEAWRLPRSVAILVLSLPAAAAFVLLVLFGLPALAEQVEALIRRAPQAVDSVARWLENVQIGLLGIDLPFIDEQTLGARLRAISPETVTAVLEEQRAAISERVWSGVLGLGRGLGTALTILGYLVLTPVLMFYLLRDYDHVIARMGTYVPRPRYPRSVAFFKEYDRLLSRYLRGQLLAAAIVGVLTWLGLWAAGFPYPGLVGAVAGVFNIIPFMGLLVSLVPAVIIALISGSFLASMLKVAIVFGVVQMLDANVIGPRIVGESVGLHPVWVILAIAIAGFFLGFAGLLLAIPAAILIKLLLELGLERYRASPVYTGGDGPSSAT